MQQTRIVRLSKSTKYQILYIILIAQRIHNVMALPSAGLVYKAVIPLK